MPSSSKFISVNTSILNNKRSSQIEMEENPDNQDQDIVLKPKKKLLQNNNDFCLLNYQDPNNKGIINIKDNNEPVVENNISEENKKKNCLIKDNSSEKDDFDSNIIVDKLNNDNKILLINLISNQFVIGKTQNKRIRN